MNVFKSPLLKRARYHRHTRTVQRRIYNLEVFLSLYNLRIYRHSLYEIEIYLVYILTDDLYQLLVSFEVYIFYLHLVDLVDDARVVRSKHLCTVCPVCLISVVLTRIVACRDVYAALTSEVAYCERAFRRRTHIVEEIYLDTVCREYVSNGLGKQAAVVAAVVAYNNRNLLHAGKVLLQIVCQSLCCKPYGIYVHAVASCAHDAAQSARTELEVLVEALYKVGFVFFFQHFFYCGTRISVERRRQPFLSFLLTLLNQFGVIFHIII